MLPYFLIHLFIYLIAVLGGMSMFSDGIFDLYLSYHKKEVEDIPLLIKGTSLELTMASRYILKEDLTLTQHSKQVFYRSSIIRAILHLIMAIGLWSSAFWIFTIYILKAKNTPSLVISVFFLVLTAASILVSLWTWKELSNNDSARK